MVKVIVILFTLIATSLASQIEKVLQAQGLRFADAYEWEKTRKEFPFAKEPFTALYTYVLSGNPELMPAILLDYVYYRHLYRACFKSDPDSRSWLKLHIGKCRGYDILNVPTYDTSGIYERQREQIRYYLSSALAVIGSALKFEYNYGFGVIQYPTASQSFSQSVSSSVSYSLPGGSSRGSSVSYSSGISLPSLNVEEFSVIFRFYNDTEKLRQYFRQEGIDFEPTKEFLTILVNIKNIKTYEHAFTFPKVQTEAAGAGVKISQDEIFKYFAIQRLFSEGIARFISRGGFARNPLSIHYTRIVSVQPATIVNSPYETRRRFIPEHIESFTITGPVIEVELTGQKDIFTQDDLNALMEAMKRDPAFLQKVSRNALERKLEIRLYTFSEILSTR